MGVPPAGLTADRPWRSVVSAAGRSEEQTSELQSPCNLGCRLLLEKKNQYQSSGQRRPSCLGVGRTEWSIIGDPLLSHSCCGSATSSTSDTATTAADTGRRHAIFGY